MLLGYTVGLNLHRYLLRFEFHIQTLYLNDLGYVQVKGLNIDFKMTCLHFDYVISLNF